MNLQENIERIHEIMGGVITEDRMDKVIKNMIDTVGLESTFKMVGDYNLVDSFLTDEDKINYIKDEFVKVNDGNYISMEQIWQQPIRIKVDNEGRIHQIEGLHKDVVSVVIHQGNGEGNSLYSGVMMYYPKYEELSSETIDKLFRMMIGQYMNLQEQANRIKSMMGVINENNRPNVFRNMVDDIGIANAIKMVGNYYEIEPYLKEIDKVNFIKEKITKINDYGGSISLHEINEEPLYYSDEDGELHQIEWLGPTSVEISVYEDEYSGRLRDYYVKYESLPGQILDELVEILLNH
jgi:hypothetical protein